MRRTRGLSTKADYATLEQVQSDPAVNQKTTFERLHPINMNGTTTALAKVVGFVKVSFKQASARNKDNDDDHDPRGHNPGWGLQNDPDSRPQINPSHKTILRLSARGLL